MHPRLNVWAARGRYIDVAGRRIFVWEQGEGPALLALHGFPASSHDWRLVADRLPRRRFVAFDFPGFGLSDKSPTGDYSLVAQADVTEAVATVMGVEECDLLAHDMGDSVAAELLARANEGSTSLRIKKTVLLNGSVFIELAHLTRGQKLFLALPNMVLPFSPPMRPFRRQLAALFAPAHRPPMGEIEMLERLLTHDGGARLLPKTIRYIEERRKKQPRWTSGLVDFKGPLAILWGDRDPVAVAAIADRLIELRPNVVAVRWDDVAHWPQIEVPERVAAELNQILQ